MIWGGGYQKQPKIFRHLLWTAPNGMAMRDESQDHNLILKLEFQWHFPSHFGSFISKDILKFLVLTKNFKRHFEIFYSNKKLKVDIQRKFQNIS